MDLFTQITTNKNGKNQNIGIKNMSSKQKIYPILLLL